MRAIVLTEMIEIININSMPSFAFLGNLDSSCISVCHLNNEYFNGRRIARHIIWVKKNNTSTHTDSFIITYFENVFKSSTEKI